MSGNSESFEKENVTPLTHRRILMLMAFVVAVSSILGLILGTLRFSFGVLFGGILSFLNYYWMKWSLKRNFEAASVGGKPGVLGFQYILRYVAFGLLLVGVYLAETVPVTSVILGLAGFAFAIMIEGVIRIFEGN